MTRGLFFRLNQKDSYNLKNILSGIDVRKYYWVCDPSQTEGWSINDNLSFFDKSIYNGAEFLSEINKESFIIFVKISAFPLGTHIQEIHSYEDFLKSDCILLLFIVDCEEGELYIKDPALLSSIRNDLIRQGFQHIQDISEEDDRVRFDIR